MRRVIALWGIVLLASLGSGWAVAQDASGTGTATTPASPAVTTTAATTTAAPTSTAESEQVVSSTSSPAVAAADAQMDAGTYAVRLRDLEQRINALKERIFQSKARLSLLAETVLQGVVAGAQAVIVHQNQMSRSYRLVKAMYALDGARIFSRADEEGALGDQSEIEIYHGSIVPGDHTVTVNLEYRGDGYGIFSYLKGYRFRVRSAHTFTAPENKSVSLRVIGYENGGPTAPLEQRPAVRYLSEVEDLRSRSSSSSSGSSGASEGASSSSSESSSGGQ